MKKHVPFDKLRLHPPYRVFRSNRDGVIGHDVESLLSGYTFLITDSMGNHKWVHSADDIVEWFSNPRYSKVFNTFWNVDFDITASLKWLGKEFCGQLMTYGCAYYRDVYFEYVSKRFLLVRRGNVWNTYFDASQYYTPRSLDGACKTYLGRSKATPGMSKEFTAVHYDNDKVLTYCMQDSKDCAELTRLLLSDLHEMGFSPKTLSSPGTVMEEALVGAVYFPDVTKIPTEAFEYAYNAYRGGWMECFKRGHFQRLYDYDISSAYPYQVSELVSLDGGTWYYCDYSGPKWYRWDGQGWISCNNIVGVPEYGFIHCLVDIKANVSPIIYRADVNTTPKGQWYTTLTMDECAFIEERQLGTVALIKGYFFVPAIQAYKRLWAPMRRLFRQKSVLRNKWLPKAMSVSLYGKFAERDETGRTGNLLNFVYAATITARTRLQIAKYALMLPERLVMIAADGLTFNAPLPSSVLSDDFGGLRLVHSNEGVVIGTNVCTIKGKVSGGDWRPGRFDWLQLLKKHPDDVLFRLNHFRYTTLAEGVANDFRLWDEVGVFKEFPYDSAKAKKNYQSRFITEYKDVAREQAELTDIPTLGMDEGERGMKWIYDQAISDKYKDNVAKADRLKAENDADSVATGGEGVTQRKAIRREQIKRLLSDYDKEIALGKGLDQKELYKLLKTINVTPTLETIREALYDKKKSKSYLQFD